jgi:hypothetical protein
MKILSLVQSFKVTDGWWIGQMDEMAFLWTEGSYFRYILSSPERCRRGEKRVT